MTDTLFLDIENADDRLLLCSWALNDGVVTTDPRPPAKLLANPHVTLVTQGDHDPLFFMRQGLEVNGPWHNTMVMAWMLDENQPLDLEALTGKYTPALVKHKAITQRAGRLYFQQRWPLDEYDQWSDAVKWNFSVYSAKDVETLRSLYYRLRKELDTDGWTAYWEAEEVPYSSLLLRMEARGMPVSLEDTRALAEELRGLRDGHEAHLREAAGLPPVFNFNSPDHLREYLFSGFCSLPGRLPMDMDPLPSDQDFEVTKVARDYIHGNWLFRGRGLAPTPPPRKKGQSKEDGKPSTEAKELLFKHGDDPWIQEYVFDFKRPSKLLNTYLDKWPLVARGGGDCRCPGQCLDPDVYDPACRAQNLPRLYTHFKQTGTVTGRLSSADPVNLQNIPKRSELGMRVRALFRGNFVIGDYDALEMRLMAHFSGDPRLLRVFEEEGDPHLLTAHAIFGGEYDHESSEREVAKTVNYGTQYGGGAKTLAMALTLAGFPTKQDVAKEYIETLGRFYPRLTRWKNSVIWLAKDTGYVETIGGRRRRIPKYEEGAGWNRGQYGDRQAVNSIVQGSAADILRRVMLAVDHEFGRLLLIAQVHDELIWEYAPGQEPGPTTLGLLREFCETGHGFDLRVPLSMVPHICADWSEK